MLNDLRFAGQSLRPPPVFTLVAVGTPAIGIAAHTSAFSILNATQLRGLP